MNVFFALKGTHFLSLFASVTDILIKVLNEETSITVSSFKYLVPS